MRWIEGIGEAINFIEENILEELTIEKIAKQIYVSPFYFQKGFSMLCGFTVSEYIRQRRLSLAGSEIRATDNRIIDIAIKYGYDSPDSFTKAFTRFHGVTPTAVRKEGAVIKSFAPLKIKMAITGNGSATKEQVAKMLERMLHIPQEMMPKHLDATDGLAAAYCHFLQSNRPETTKKYSNWKDFIAKNPDKIG